MGWFLCIMYFFHGTPCSCNDLWHHHSLSISEFQSVVHFEVHWDCFQHMCSLFLLYTRLYCDGTDTQAPTGPCKPGYFCPGAAKTATQMMAKEGYYAPEGAFQPEPCPPGSFQPVSKACSAKHDNTAGITFMWCIPRVVPGPPDTCSGKLNAITYSY